MVSHVYRYRGRSVMAFSRSSKKSIEQLCGRAGDEDNSQQGPQLGAPRPAVTESASSETNDGLCMGERNGPRCVSGRLDLNW